MEKNEYHLIIDINGEGVGEQSPISSGSKKSDNGGKAITLLTAYNVAQPFISAAKQTIMNNVDTKTGSAELSARIGLQMSIAEMGAKTLIGMASGQSLATMLGVTGPYGAVIGAAVAIGSTIAHFMTRFNALDNQAKLENEQLQILRGRAGVQFNRSRMGE